VLVSLLLWLGLGCASLLGLEELDEVPDEFPLVVAAPTGKVTRAEHGQVSVDLVFDDEAAARAHWGRLRRTAEADGWKVTGEGRQGKLDQVTLEGPEGRLVLGCCRPRVDRRQLVFVSWWPDG